MPEQNQVEATSNDVRPADTYEAPAIETVITSDDLDREVHYAGFITGRF